MVVLLIVVYAARKVVAREALVGWLRSHGVAATAEVQGLSFSRFAGRVSVGDPRAPDFTASDAVVTFGVKGLGLEIRSVKLISPLVRARLHGGQLSVGALDPLIADLVKRPPTPNAIQPRIEIDRGVLLLTTDDGPVRLNADAVIDGGRLVSLSAATAPTQLRAPTFEADLGAGRLTLTTRADRVSFALDAPVTALTAGGVSASNSRLRLTGEAPYPDLKGKRIAGAVKLRAELTGRLATSGATVKAATLTSTFDGQATGGVESLALTGRITADLDALAGASGQMQFRSMRATAVAEDLAWRRRGDLTATPSATALVQGMKAAGLSLTPLHVELAGPVRYGPGGLAATLNAGVAGHGAWAGLGQPAPADDAQLAAVKRAARGFQLAAPAVRLELNRAALAISLPQPAMLKPDAGGVVSLSGHAGSPVFGTAGSGFSLLASGGGLPRVSADVRRLRIADGAITAQGSVTAAGSVGPVRDGAVSATGTLKSAAGKISFDAAGCVPIKARRLELGANSVEQLSGEVCQGDRPIFAMTGGAWQLDAQAAHVAAAVPNLQLRLEDGAGRVQAAQTHGELSATALIDVARIVDTSISTRFNPAQIGGHADLAKGLWSADLTVRDLKGRHLARATLRHDTASGRGGLDVDTGRLIFASGGLQPAELSPLAQAIGSPAEGEVRFTGRLAWTLAGATSSGELAVPHLDFLSPAGAVKGLSGTLAFTSLVPLVAAPGQSLKIESVATLVPLTRVTATFGLDDKALTLSGGEAAVGGGRVIVERLSLPLVAHAPIAGALKVEGVQLHDLVAASPFGDKVDLDARVSGRIPFDSLDGKVRILGGDLHAIQAGRLSISRRALRAVAPSGSVASSNGQTATVAPNDTFTDFAYQAMENLAFTTLDAGVSTRADGRLATLFHIVGRHDPPQRQEINLSLFDLIGRKFLNRPLPLPSDTAVDLTLDTTLNLDDLLADYADYQRLRSSHAVQAGPPNLHTQPMETPR